MGDLISALFSEALFAVLIVGVILGLLMGGIGWGIYYLCHHVTIGWA